MKRLLTMMMYCSAALIVTAQVPAYEHVPYQKDRKAPRHSRGYKNFFIAARIFL
ncbi:MAG: hypothetical protein ABR502_11440 [Chitinophagaceae bacterium]